MKVAGTLFYIGGSSGSGGTRSIHKPIRIRKAAESETRPNPRRGRIRDVAESETWPNRDVR